MTTATQNPAQILAGFVQRYGPEAGEHGPEMFVREQLGVELDEWQVTALRAYGRGERRISLRSCHGPGKTAWASWCIVHQQVTKYPQKTAVTAPTGGQLYDALFAEVKKWFKKLPDAIQGLYSITGTRIELVSAKEESFASFRTARPENPEALQGVHCDDGFVLLVADEASGVPESNFEAAASSMSGHNCTTVLLGNPVRTSGFFFDTHHKLKDMWFRLHITGVEDSKGIYSKRVSSDFVEDIARRYGRESNAFYVRVLGEFPRSDLDTIISFELVQAAKTRDVTVNDAAPIVWGLDVARYGDDSTVLCKRQANVVADPPMEHRKLNTMEVVGFVMREWKTTADHLKPKEVMIDAIGLGAGVADRLRELGLPAVDVNVSELPSLNTKDLYVDLRTDLWFDGKEWFEARNCKIPDDSEYPLDRDGTRKDNDLADELVQTKYEFAESSGKIKAESKKKAKKRKVPSPNYADAFLLTFAGTAGIALRGNTGSNWDKPLKRGLKRV